MNKIQYDEFEKRAKGKTLDEIIHEGRKKTKHLLESQGISAIALYISEVLMKSIYLEKVNTIRK